MTAHLMYLAAAHHAHRVNGGGLGIGLLLIAIGLFWPSDSKKKG